MAERVDPFAALSSPPVFAPKPRPEKPVANDVIDRLSDENKFPSRQAPKPVREAKRKRRAYTTGRNRQFNIRVTNETMERFYKMADERKIPLCALLEQALDALEGRGIKSAG